MAVVTDPDQDNEKLNPGAWDDEKGARRGVSSGLSEAENNSFNDIAGNFDKTADPTQEDANISRVKDAESRGTKKDSPATDKSDSKKEDSKSSNALSRVKLGNLRKKGPIAFVVSLLTTAVSLFMIANTPGLLIVQLKEILFDDLMDMVASMEMRGQNIIKARINNDVVSGKGCSKKSIVRCKYKGMSEKQMDKLRKAGIEVKTSGKTITGKYKVESLKMAGASPPDDKPIASKDLKKFYNDNPEFRLRMNKAYSPRWLAFKDDTFKKIKTKYKISLNRAVGGQTEDEMKRKLNEDIKNGTTDEDVRGGRLKTDENGKTTIVDPVSGEDATNSQGVAADGNDVNERTATIEQNADPAADFSARGNSFMSGLGKGLNGLNQFTGSQAAVCATLTTLRTAGVASRNLKFVQLLRYIIPFLNTADSIKNGTATPQAVSLFGDNLTKEDRKKKVSADEDTAIQASDSLAGVAQKTLSPTEGAQKDNPDYGKSAVDAAPIRTAAYGETSNLSARDTKFSHNGAAGSKLSGIGNSLKSNLPGFDSSRCSLYTNPAVQIVGLVGSIGLSVAGCAGVVTCAASVGKPLIKTLPILILQYAVTNWAMNMVANITKGALVNADLTGVDAGGALFSGAAALGGVSSSARGMQPVSTQAEISEYQVTAMKSKQQDYETDQILARSTPFDIYNDASFLGSIVWNIAPSARESSRTMAGIVSMPLQLLGNMPSWLMPGAHAATLSSMDRYTKNDEDEIYKSMDLKGSDIMGNVRYAMSDEQLNADPTKVVEWMVDARQVDSTTGAVLKDKSALEQAACIPAANPDEISRMSFDDESDIAKVDTPSSHKGVTAQQAAYELPYPIAGRNDAGCSESSNEAYITDYASEDPEKDVRTYAHFLRYCRMGDDTGRRVAFGDGDGGEKDGIIKNVLNGLSSSEWQSDGRECLRSHACKPGQDPNGDSGAGDNRWETFCRPSYYDIYAVYTMDNGGDGKTGIGDTMDKDEEEQDDDKSSAVGNAQEEAKKVLANQNIILLDPTRQALQKFADTGQATNACNEKFGINPLLLWVMNENSKKYKIWVNNFGFKEDRFITECIATSGYQHPRGNAVDLNGVELATSSTASATWGSISYTPEQTKTITDYTVDWMNALATKEPTRGRVGQLGCGGFNILTNPQRSKWQGPDGNLQFDDSCNHLHIEATDRINIKKDDPK